MDKKNIQEKDLGNVSGGGAIYDGEVYRTCRGCGTEFDLKRAEKKTVSDGCTSSKDYFKCPNCGKWVDSDGKVQG